MKILLTNYNSFYFLQNTLNCGSWLFLILFWRTYIHICTHTCKCIKERELSASLYLLYLYLNNNNNSKLIKVIFLVPPSFHFLDLNLIVLKILGALILLPSTPLIFYKTHPYPSHYTFFKFKEKCPLKYMFYTSSYLNKNHCLQLEEKAGTTEAEKEWLSCFSSSVSAHRRISGYEQQQSPTNHSTPFIILQVWHSLLSQNSTEDPKMRIVHNIFLYILKNSVN